MAIISREEILKIARISQLEIHESEIEALRQQLESVLSYAERVKEIAANVTEPTTKNSNVFRQDVIIPTDVAPILAQAPDSEGQYFVVPAVLDAK